MYTLVSAVAKQLSGNKDWVNVNISTMKLERVFALYSRVIVILNNSFYTNQFALDLDLIRDEIVGLDIAFPEYLVLNGNKTLPTTTTLPTIKETYVKYADAFRAGYKVTPISPTASIDSVLPIKEKTMLHLARKGTDYKLFYESCLVNVNGYFHLTDYDENGIYIEDGMKSQFLSNKANIGICSFREIGKLTFKPITNPMIYKQHATEELFHNTYIDVGQDITDKTVLLVIGGYLHGFGDDVVSRVSPTSLKIKFSNIPYLDRYYESRNYIDLSSLNLSSTSKSKTQIAVNELYSDEAIRAYFTLSQSFIVILDNPSIFTKKIPLHKTPFPDMFIAHQIPDKPLFVGAGKVTNYWTTYEDQQYSVTCDDTLRQNYVYDTIIAENNVSVNSSRVPINPLAHSIPHMLMIGCANI